MCHCQNESGCAAVCTPVIGYCRRRRRRWLLSLLQCLLQWHLFAYHLNQCPSTWRAFYYYFCACMCICACALECVAVWTVNCSPIVVIRWLEVCVWECMHFGYCLCVKFTYLISSYHLSVIFSWLFCCRYYFLPLSKQYYKSSDVTCSAPFAVSSVHILQRCTSIFVSVPVCISHCWIHLPVCLSVCLSVVLSVYAFGSFHHLIVISSGISIVIGVVAHQGNPSKCCCDVWEYECVREVPH